MSLTLKELYAEKVLLEALDPQKLQQMVQTIGTIEGIVAPFKDKLPSLAAAINQAKEMAAQKLSGGGSGGFLKKLAANIGDKFNLVDDLKDFITFQASILQGLRSIPTVVGLLKKVSADPEAGQFDPEAPLEDMGPNAQAQMSKVLLKSFSPPAGIFSKKQIPFVQDMNAFVKDFFNLSYNEISQLAKQSGRAPGIPFNAGDVKALVSASPQDAAKQLANVSTNPSAETSGAPGVDASGQKTGNTPTQATATGPGAAQEPAKKAQGQKGAAGAKALPDFETAMKFIGAANMNDPANKKTVEKFRQFYNYLAKNPK